MTFKRELIYQDRLVAFVDILGFKDAVNKSGGADEWCIKLRKKINRLVDNNESFQVYNDAFKVLYEEQLKGKAEETAEITFFSDCIVFSSEVAKNINDNIVTKFLKFIMNLAIETANFGFLLRGGITFGKIRHDHNKCFGPAMNRAYLLESETAVYRYGTSRFSEFQSVLQEFRNVHSVILVLVVVILIQESALSILVSDSTLLRIVTLIPNRSSRHERLCTGYPPIQTCIKSVIVVHYM